MKTKATWSRRDVLLAGAATTALPWSITAADAKPHRLPRHIVDCQVHIWDGGKPSPTGRQGVFLAEDMLKEMDEAGVDRAVLVTPSWSPNGNGYSLQAAQKYSKRFAVMGNFDISAPPDPKGLADWKKQKGMLGISLFLASPKGKAWMTDGSADWFWPVLEKHGIPLMIFASGMMPTLANIASKYPHLRIAIDQFGIPTSTFGTQGFADYDAVLAMAKHPNVTIKLESVPFISTEPYPYANLHPVLHRLYDTFGPHRMFWGSDFTLLKTPYKDCVTFMKEIPWLTDRDLDLIMGRSISRWIGWPLPA
ncbi:MAG TPA: amidohydrolase family protein [Stellaceae bacterium]|jgi:predicted TIM-barrel fold metal-dependent hydrolase|nr:amidohydrolase family protein [Stellaceae bacterium]